MLMEEYLLQLIEDLRAAAGNVPQPGELWSGVDMNNPAEVEDIAYVEYLQGKPQPLFKIVGIEKVVFPPMEKLTEAQTIILYREMELLLKAYHFAPFFPEGLPEIHKYHLLLAHWESDQIFVSAGTCTIEFCNYEGLECPFPEEYCGCQKFEEEESDEPFTEKGSEGELPF